MRKSLIEEFELEEKKNVSFIPDYDVFKDKKLLDDLRKKIISHLLDQPIIGEENKKEFLDYQINKELESYDLSTLERGHIYNLIENELYGYGPITELLDDKSVTEIMVNGPDDIYVEVDGKIVKDETLSFINNNHILRTIERIIEPLGKTLDSSNPMVDARLNDGSRLNAIIPPLSVNGPVLTIRKFKKDMDTIDDMIANGTLTPYMARFLESCVKAKLNIVVCGGTGSGKTTLLNVLSSFIHNDERIITIEDAPELKLNQNHVVSLETRSDNYQNGKEVTMRDLLRNSLRMRPDRIIVGEVRGEEALDMLQAMNTGHEGSLTTLHANSPRDAMHRIETMVLMNQILIPVPAIREYIESAIDIVVEIRRLSDGRRKVTNISEVVGFKEDEIFLQSIFAFRQNGINENNDVNGEFVLYNYVPKVYDRIKQKGITDIDDIFENIEKNEKPKKTSKKKKEVK